MCCKNRLVTFFAAVLLCAGGLYFLWATGFFRASVSVEGVQQYIRGFYPYSQLVFFVIQLLSVIVAPIPSNISAAAGGALFGTWVSFGLTMGAVVLGSVTVFVLARRLGRSFVDRVVSGSAYQRYMDVVRRKQNVFLILAFLFPFFPDDMICALAGLTDIPFSRFFLIVLLTRPWGLLFASALGGAALHATWWWMALAGVLGGVVFVLGMKYAERLEQWVLHRVDKRSNFRG